MGQRHGKAAYVKAAAPFVNASEKDVNRLWEAFNDIAEGFGLNQDEMCEICRSLMPTLEIYAKVDMDQLTGPLFNALDTDENGLVDALEFLGTIAVMSAMTIPQKLTFVYNCYDFNESGQISIDELTLALRSTLTGLCKLSANVLCPTELVLEDMALHAFHKSQKHGPEDYITLAEFLRFAETTPEMTSWIDYFDCPDETVEENDREDSDLENEATAAAVHPYGLGAPSDPAVAVAVARKRDPSFPCDAKVPSFETSEPVPAAPWQAVVSNAAPSAPPTINPNAPAASLELDWVYGFNSDLRNVVKYVTPAEVVYPAGCVAVLYDVLEHKQRFAFHHAGLVQAVAVHPADRHVLATGERGLVPTIVVWTTRRLSTPLCVVRGFHRQGVAHLAWMPNGRTLVSIGQDSEHCVAVYQWELASPPAASSTAPTSSTSTSTSTSLPTAIEWSRPPTLIFADRCGAEPVHACAVLSSTVFVTAGRRHLFFWTRERDERYTSQHALFARRPGVLGRKAQVQTLVSLAPMAHDPNMVLAGTARGQILVFEGRNCVRVLHAHAAAVNVLQDFAGGVLSGGRDGKIRLWSKRLEPGAQFDIEALGCVIGGSGGRVRSLVASPDGGAKLLIATSGAEIYEIAASDGSNLHFGAMLCGHFGFELHGLAVHPTKREFATVGDDRSVRVWDLGAHRQLRMALLEAPARTCAYSPDGSLLAVGHGASEDLGAATLSEVRRRALGKLVNPNKQGAFAVLSEATLAVKYEAKDSKKYIRTVKFSGDGLTLAVGSNDAFIYAYNTEDWASKGKCKARDTTAVLSHFDFSTTGEYIQASAGNKGEMVFFESASGVEITRVATLKDVEWLTTNCPFGWAVQGAWARDQREFVELTALARTSPAASQSLLVVGDALGGLRLFRYPCVSPVAVAHEASRAASSAISRVAFSSDNAVVLASAQDERCVFQWRVEYEDEDFAGTLGADGITPTGGGLAEFEYHPTSDDELEVGHGDPRTPFDEAAAAGDFALELLHDAGGVVAPPGTGETGNAAGTTTAASSSATAPPPPVRAWVASAIAPSEPPDESDAELLAVPGENLELEWVYGYHCDDVRNNLFLSRAKGWLVYPAANLVVVLDPKLWLQRHFKQHTDVVTALAVHSGHGKRKNRPPTTAEGQPSSDATDGNGDHGAAGTWLSSLEVVASGQMGARPVIHVWRLDTLEVLMSLRGFHRQGIAELRFNAAGTLLVTIGLDPHHSMAVYDWQSGSLVAHAACTAAGGPGRILGVAFQNDPDVMAPTMLCTAGVKAITFWRLAGHHVVKKDAILGRKGLLQTFLSVVYSGRDAIVGTMSGDLYRFKGLELASIIPAHTRGVAALYALPHAPFHLVSGGKDGLVKLWSADLECLGEFGEFNAPRHPIRSVFWQQEKNHVAVGTRGSGIFVLSSLDGAAVRFKTPDGNEVGAIDGHSRRELHGLGVCPSKERFATTGDDGVLRVWDLSRHVQILAKELETASRACAYSYDGDFIAVGLGGGATAKRHKKDGSLLVFEERGGSVELVYETRDTKQSISVIKYAPDGQSLVVGSLDNCIYMYDVPNNYSKRAVFNKHKSWITHIDISSDSQYIRSNCGGWELLFADITTGSHVASATALRNQQWETCSTVFNWANQGAWPATPAGRAIEITASAASLPGSAVRKEQPAVLATGTAQGRIQLTRYPCFRPGAGAKSYAGHHGPVGQLGFSGLSSLGGHCLSIGRVDRCILQWRKTRAPGPGDVLGETVGNALVHKDLEVDEDMVREGLFIPEAFVNVPATQSEVKPYLSVILPPSAPAEAAEPSDREGPARGWAFDLEHVFGVRLHDVRNNVVYAKTKHVITHTGALGVQYDRRTHRQRFYRGHARPIVSLAATPDGGFVATGEICREHLQSERPRVQIWEPASGTQVTELSAFHTRAVSYLAFDPTGRRLASVGQDGFHSLAIHSSTTGLWYDAALLASTQTTARAVYFVCFIEDPSAAPYHVVTGGHDHVLFWRLDAPNLVGTYGVFGAKAQAQPILCGASLGGLVVTGASTGHLYVWESGVVTRALPGHEGPVYAIHATAQGCVTGGGRDGLVKFWSRQLAPMATFSVHDAKPACQLPGIRALCWDVAEDRVLIATKGGEVLELSRLTGETSLVTESHFDPTALHGLSPHPTRPELVATAGGDHTVRVWDLAKREVVVKLTLDGALRSVAYSPDGKWLAVGFGNSDGTPSGGKDGAFLILDGLTLEILHEGRDSKQAILDIKFSPDLTLLALASADHIVYFYSTLDSFALRFKFAKLSGRAIHMDFAADSGALRVNSDALELAYVSTLDGSAITTPSTMKDTTWATQSCVFTWATQGLWDASREGEYVNAVTRAWTRPVLAAATNAGQVRIYNSPCLSKRTEQHVLTGHGLNVSNVAFTCDDSRLVSIGRDDKSLLVWRIHPGPGAAANGTPAYPTPSSMTTTS